MGPREIKNVDKFYNRDEWRGYVPPYAPRFSNGWAPGPSVVEELGHTMDRRDYAPPSNRGVSFVES